MTQPNTAGADSGHWDRYWATARIAACFEGADANYEADIQREWEEFFLALPQGARVLDVGTGNGAIPMIARRVSEREGLGFSITGIDAADINPRRHLGERAMELEGVVFHGRVDAAALPFEDASFDALCSQFSVEYMERAPVLAELARVAAPGARLQLVVHSSPGIAEEGAAAELALRDFLLQDLKVTDKARRTQLFVAGLERAGGAPSEEDDARARKLVNSFETALGRLHRRIEETGSPMLKNVMGVLVRSHQQRHLFSEEQLTQNIDTLELEIESHAARLRELRAAALDAQALQGLAQELEAAGFARCTSRPLQRGSDYAQLGWLLETEKP